MLIAVIFFFKKTKLKLRSLKLKTIKLPSLRNYYNNLYTNGLLMFKYLKKRNIKRSKIRLSRILLKNPQKKSIVVRVAILTPRKPNSARRKSIKGRYKTGKTVYSYVPGGDNQLKKFSNTLIKGKGARDLPGIYTNAIRGCLDLPPLQNKTRRRSIYGTQKNHV